MDRVRFMSMGRREGRQTPMWLPGTKLAQSPGHRFYEKLNELLSESGFDRRVEQICAPYFEADDKPGRPSIAPGVYFRMLFVGYFEGIESERGLEWRCSDSLSLRTFFGLRDRCASPSATAGTRQRPQALSRARRGAQSRTRDENALRSRNTAAGGERRARGRCCDAAPAPRHDPDSRRRRVRRLGRR